MNFLTNKNLWTYFLVALFASLAGTLPILINPGLFWDDWVWIYQSKESAIQIGRELGIWWAGYLTNYINGLENPAITMRWVSLISWIIGSGSFSYVIYKENLVSGRDSFLIFLLCISTQISPLRFVISLSMYNVYIASFWLGCAVLKMDIKSSYKVPLSAAFFLGSFYLNSILALYSFLLVSSWVVKKNYPINNAKYFKIFRDNINLFNRGNLAGKDHHPEGNYDDKVIAKIYTLESLRIIALKFFKENLFWILLPITFTLVKKISSTSSATYGNYNKIDLGHLFQSIFDSFSQIFSATKFLVSLGSLHPRALFLVFFLISLIFLWLIPNSKKLPTEKLFSKLIFGILLFMASVMPYLIVGKPPIIGDPYESRHLMLGVFPLIFIVLTSVNIFIAIVFKDEKNKLYAKNILVSYLLATSISSAFISGMGLWRDFFSQKAFQNFIEDNKSRFKDITTFIIIDKTKDRFYGNRMIWAYEFTGNLVNIYPNKDHLAVKLEEFNSWPIGVSFLREDFYKKRYNFDNYQFSNRQALITIDNGKDSFKYFRIFSLVKSYMYNEDLKEQLQNFIEVKSGDVFIDADKHVINLVKIKKSLESFRIKNGQYPLSGTDSNNGYVVKRINTGNSLDPAIGDIPRLFPGYMKKPKEMVLYKPLYPYYLYYSDGKNYKLIYNNANDIHYVAQAYPDLIDLNRVAAYGFWSEGARSW